MRKSVYIYISALLLALPSALDAAEAESAPPVVTFSSLLHEMTDRSVVTHWPVQPYHTLEASSYNRASKTPDDYNGWFANGDYGYVLRMETNGGRQEAVLMEHEGPGVITRIWTPFFYQDFKNRKGTDLRIYIDGETTPRLSTNFIALVRGEGPVKPPFAQPTCRAGDLYLPIPFQKSCKITQEDAAFFYNINYRTYAPGTKVESFRPEFLNTHRALLDQIGTELNNPGSFTGGSNLVLERKIPAGQSEELDLPGGSAAIRRMEFQLKAANLPQALRSTVLEMDFDGERTVWCPLGDFFSNVNGIDPYRMWEREVRADGTMICRWIMPYQIQGRVRLLNQSSAPVTVNLQATISPWQWTTNSLHFHTSWVTDGPFAPRPVFDMNFIEVKGRGIHVGDTLVVLNPLESWWGEGDEKIYADDDFDRRFPSQHGTGAEDYYGWAGGVQSTRNDEFSSPFLANVRVGGQTRGLPAGQQPFTHGYNICTRTRSLDATPFDRHFKFDMEAYNMAESPDAFLQYARITYWYGATGATNNCPPMPVAAARPVLQTEDLQVAAMLGNIPAANYVKDLVELEDVKEVTLSPGMQGERQEIGTALPPYHWSNNAQFFGRATSIGDSVTFTLSGQTHSKRILLYPSLARDYGILNFYVNDKLAVKNWDGYAEISHPGRPVALGVQEPDDGNFRFKAVVVGKSKNSTGYNIGLDAIELEDLQETENSAAVREFLHTDVFNARPCQNWPQLVGLMNRPWGKAAVAILWNPGVSDQASTLDFTAAGLDPRQEYAIWSYRNGSFIGFAKGYWTTPILPAGGSSHVCITEMDRSRSVPILLGSTLDKYCGAATIKSFQARRSDLQIELTDAGAKNGEIFVYSPLVLFYKNAVGSSVPFVGRVGENIWKIVIADREPGRLQSVQLGIKLPLMQQTNFWLVVGVTLTATMFGVWWFKHAHRVQLAMARLEYQNAVERERGRISRDIHDDLGAKLTEISLLSEIPQRNAASTQETLADIQKIGVLARNLTASLSEIVWAVNPKNDTLENFVAYACNYTQDYLQHAGIRCRLYIPDHLPNSFITSEFRHHLFLVIKEALNNVVKHAMASEVTMSFTLETDGFKLMIKDNGKGIYPLPKLAEFENGTTKKASRVGRGNGLVNMRERIEQMGGRFDLSSQPGAGTKVEMTVPNIKAP